MPEQQIAVIDLFAKRDRDGRRYIHNQFGEFAIEIRRIPGSDPEGDEATSELTTRGRLKMFERRRGDTSVLVARLAGALFEVTGVPGRPSDDPSWRLSSSRPQGLDRDLRRPTTLTPALPPSPIGPIDTSLAAALSAAGDRARFNEPLDDEDREDEP